MAVQVELVNFNNTRRNYMETLDTNLSFGDALELLKRGHSVSRKGWNGKGLRLVLQRPDEHSKMTLPYIYMQYPSTPASENAPASHKDARVPWLASQTDMLAEDWSIIK